MSRRRRFIVRNEPSSSRIDLKQIARGSLIQQGFQWRFPSGVARQVKRLTDTVAECADPQIRDLRDLLWSSIDNEESQDLDQIAHCERDGKGLIRVRVAIADVDHYVKKGSDVDVYAAKNGTSIYTGIETFPMLPDRLSTDLTSLRPGQDRLAVVIEFCVDTDGHVHRGHVYRALVHNRAKLIYEEIGAWIAGETAVPRAVTAVKGLTEQIKLQDQTARRLQALRRSRGALEFETIEVRPIVEGNDVLRLEVRLQNRAHELIENFMIAANGVMATFIKKQGYPLIQRMVPVPERWDKIREVAHGVNARLPHEPDAVALSTFLERQQHKDPERFPDLSLTIIKLLGKAEYGVSYPRGHSEGHFGLAVEHYAHSTAPNRRYVDLIIQRILKSVLKQQPEPYTPAELEDVAAWCTERDHAAKKVERFLMKVCSAVLLRPRVGEMFSGIVTGASDKGTYVRLLDPPAEGKVMSGANGMDIGDKVTVRLMSVNPSRGFIDFERVEAPGRGHAPRPVAAHPEPAAEPLRPPTARRPRGRSAGRAGEVHPRGPGKKGRRK